MPMKDDDRIRFIFRKRRRIDVGDVADTREVAPSEAYLGVRSHVLALVRDRPGGVATHERVLALVVESRFPSSVSAIAARADGTTGLYFHDGRRMLGADEDEGRVAAVRSWLQSCEELFEHLTPVGGDPPLPALRTSAFLAVTADGDFAGSIPHAELNGHPLVGLWAKGEGVRREVLRWRLKGDPEAYAP
jgi:hypothetical protein